MVTGLLTMRKYELASQQGQTNIYGEMLCRELTAVFWHLLTHGKGYSKLD